MNQEDIVYMRMPMHNIKWCGLYDQNSNKLHAAVHAQLLLQFTHELKYNERNEGLMPGLKELQDGARYALNE